MTSWLLCRRGQRLSSTASHQDVCCYTTPDKALFKGQLDTDFLKAGGPHNYTWNVLRSEADSILFHYAGECGCKTFDGVKVTSLEFRATEPSVNGNVGFLESASWTRRDKSTGSIQFEYLVDASGRAGLMSTKYLKDRRYNEGLKNTAIWGYFKNAATYGVGTSMEGSPYFSRLEGNSSAF